jgi:hypothetical protein
MEVENNYWERAAIMEACNLKTMVDVIDAAFAAAVDAKTDLAPSKVVKVVKIVKVVKVASFAFEQLVKLLVLTFSKATISFFFNQLAKVAASFKGGKDKEGKAKIDAAVAT